MNKKSGDSNAMHIEPSISVMAQPTNINATLSHGAKTIDNHEGSSARSQYTVNAPIAKGVPSKNATDIAPPNQCGASARITTP